MDRATRNTLRLAVTQCRRLLEGAIGDVLQGQFGVHAGGTIEPDERMTHLSAADLAYRDQVLAHLGHIEAAGLKPAEAVAQLVREVAFTHLNRLCAYKMMEQRKLIREAVSRGMTSNGFLFYLGDHPDDEALWSGGQQDVAYRHFLEWLAGTLSREIGVLFSPHDLANRLFPPQRVLEQVLEQINGPELAAVWSEDEAIGWVYQYFTPKELRDQARKESAAPRNAYELAFRNQFFTPRYVVEFLVDNTLGRTWYDMRHGDTRLTTQCRYLVRRPTEVFLGPGEDAPDAGTADGLTQEELLKQPVYVPHRPKKDPRALRILDPACGSGHFLLYCYDLLQTIYEEAWTDPDLSPGLWQALGWTPRVERQDDGPVADPATVRLRLDAEAHCFRCGWTGRVPEASFILADLYDSPWTAGRPMTYCATCCQEMAQRIRLRMPLAGFSFAEALRRGYFSHATGTMFLEMARVFSFAMTDQRDETFDRLNAANQDESLQVMRAALPGLILAHNLHGIDIDRRATQIAALALWLRAQRAYQEAGLKAADRPAIERSNIVCAEPMPGEATFLDEFVARLEPAVLGRLVRTVFERMTLAGESGSLLKIEDELRDAIAACKRQWSAQPRHEQLALFPKPERPSAEQLSLFEIAQITDEQFWDEAEARVLDALRDYAEQATASNGFQRRLFAADTAQGFAFIDVCRQRYDVVLMNPPFGAASTGSKRYIDARYPRTKNDVYAAFVERGLGWLWPRGLLGAITSRTGFFLTSFQRWREEILLKEARPTVVADLGQGVLDTAMVETAAYCLEASG